MYLAAQKWFWFFLFVLGFSPTSAMSQADGVSFEKLWDRQTGSGIYGGVQIDEKRLYAGDADGIRRKRRFHHATKRCLGPQRVGGLRDDHATECANLV